MQCECASAATPRQPQKYPQKHQHTAIAGAVRLLSRGPGLRRATRWHAGGAAKGRRSAGEGWAHLQVQSIQNDGVVNSLDTRVCLQRCTLDMQVYVLSQGQGMRRHQATSSEQAAGVVECGGLWSLTPGGIMPGGMPMGGGICSKQWQQVTATYSSRQPMQPCTPECLQNL
jgi:hypothetical protein